MESVSSPDACSKDKSKMQFDGWYIDAAFALNCETEQYVNNRQNSQAGGCQDRHQVKQVGTAKRGYPVWEKTTMFDESGKESYSMLSEVLELSNATLDAALFDVPSDYREVKDSTELYALMSNSNQSNSSSANNNSSGNDSGMSSTVQSLSKSASNTNAEVGEKKAGVIRVGLAGVKTGSVGEGMNATELAGAIQNTLSEYLKSPNVELVALESKLAQTVDAEAKQKECDFVIYANVAHRKCGGGGMFGKMLGNIASSAVSSAGYGSSSVAGIVAGQAASQAIYTAANASENVKSKDEITLDIKVKSTGGAQTLTKQFKAKAKSNGEDIISPIIEQAAQAILDAVSKK